jgi:carbamoyl-phosphate synthase large subunit
MRSGLGYYGKSLMHAEELLEYIKTPKWDRIFRIKDALMAGISVGTISKATNGIDRWFLYEIQKICNMEKELTKYKIDTLPLTLLQEAKQLGLAMTRSSGS